MNGNEVIMQYININKEMLESEFQAVKKEYERLKAQGLKLDMSRGKPSAEQLDITDGMLSIIDGSDCTVGNNDYRNYGIVDGIPEAKELFSELMGCEKDEIIVMGNSSLNIMYDTILRAFVFGIDSCKAWAKCEKVKFLCPVPGYDRHFRICEKLGIEMINIDMTPDGPDMDAVEQLVEADDSIKGIWCVPKYSNPQGITYSDETVKRFAALKPKARDFRIFWDNAYCVHDLYDEADTLLNLLDECKKAGNDDLPYIFASTSKISYPGAGVGVIASSKKNINSIKAQISTQTIGHDKLNQLRHVKFFKNTEGIMAQMKKHADIMRPKFEIVLNALSKEFTENNIITWTHPKGGYFISVDLLDGCAKRTVQLCEEAGVKLTEAGATYPYGNDPRDRNIRIAPTYPTTDELSAAVEIFCLCVKYAAIEKLISE